MKAVILAAGRGSRMGDATDERPKCLVELNGRPLLDYQTAALRAAGIGDIAVVTGYQRERLQPFGLREFHNAAWARTNMVHSLTCAADWLAAGPCIVSYADIFYETQAVTALIENAGDLCVLYDVNWREAWTARFEDPLSDAETFDFDADGRLTEIGNRPRTVDEVKGQYMGLLAFGPTGWAAFAARYQGLDAEARARCDMTTMLRGLIADRPGLIKAVPYAGRWGEIDTQSDLAVYSAMLQADR